MVGSVVGFPLPTRQSRLTIREHAVRVAEAALLCSGGSPSNEVNYGWVKLLNV
jgi:hypothetical protein